ncbi:hypothetical protein HALDL1_03705 [Halobacterium sp. DL1]|nr:hypothetical protein HALDL1_03705 [Halobacterium sp. DL1]
MSFVAVSEQNGERLVFRLISGGAIFESYFLVVVTCKLRMSFALVYTRIVTFNC